MSLWRYGTLAVRMFEPERAHELTVSGLKTGLGPKFKNDLYPALKTEVAGLTFPNPLGMAAGFDKNAMVPDPLLKMGFGFAEVGAVTPRPQTGNDRPRVFRLPQEQAVINRYGFNNDGLEVVGERLKARVRKPGIIGINLGSNKDSDDRVADYVTGLQALEEYVSFCTVNISSPNTPGLRALQGRASLQELLARVLQARRTTTPVFVKVAPDLTDEDKADIVAVTQSSGIDGLIVSNTTIARPEGLSKHGDEKGGLSGAPLFVPSTEVLKEFARELHGQVPLIGVGGISTPDQAYAKIRAGASLIQLYTALIYRGPDLIPSILSGLVERLALDGFASVADAVGADL